MYFMYYMNTFIKIVAIDEYYLKLTSEGVFYGIKQAKIWNFLLLIVQL